MKAAELYQLLAATLRPSLVGRGFKKLRGSRLAFQRVARDTYQTVWFQCDKYGWDAYAGSRFFVGFTVSESPTYDTGGHRDEGLFFFLTDAELAGARDFRDSVVARIPRPPAAYFDAFEKQLERRTPADAEAMLAAIRAQFEPEPIPYRRHQDVGMRYWLPTDVTWWATLIESILPRAIERMDSWSGEIAAQERTR
jgi:hypothetical protein